MIAFVTFCSRGLSTFTGTGLKGRLCDVSAKTAIVMRLGASGRGRGMPGGGNGGSNKMGGKYKVGGGGDGGSGSGSVGGGKGRGGDGTFGAANREGNPFERGYAWYLGWLQSRPIITKMLTSFVGFAIADLLLHNILSDSDGPKSTLDRVVFGEGDASIWGALRTALFGALFHGLCGHYYYTRLESLLVGGKFVQLWGKTFSDSILWPPFLILTRLVYSKLLKGGKEFGSLWGEIKGSKLYVQGSFLLWVPMSYLNFKYVASAERILLHNIVLVVLCGVRRLWNVSFTSRPG